MISNPSLLAWFKSSSTWNVGNREHNFVRHWTKKRNTVYAWCKTRLSMAYSHLDFRVMNLPRQVSQRARVRKHVFPLEQNPSRTALLRQRHDWLEVIWFRCCAFQVEVDNSVFRDGLRRPRNLLYWRRDRLNFFLLELLPVNGLLSTGSGEWLLSCGGALVIDRFQHTLRASSTECVLFALFSGQELDGWKRQAKQRQFDETRAQEFEICGNRTDS